MRRYLLDTGAAGDVINRRHGAYERAQSAFQQGDVIGLATPVLGELLAGIEGSVSREPNLSRLAHGIRRLRIWSFDKAAAEECGRLAATLKRIGRPMQQIDVQIAATALSLGNCTVVTRDSDFAAVPGLDIVDWSLDV
jgi:tRNA(fMet)-specific endonuclease VapC